MAVDSKANRFEALVDGGRGLRWVRRISEIRWQAAVSAIPKRLIRLRAWVLCRIVCKLT